MSKKKFSIFLKCMLNEGDFCDWCHENGYEVEEMDFDQWLNERMETEYEMLQEYLNQYDNECIITGTLGLWWGTATLEPTHATSVNAALNRMLGGGYDLLEVNQYSRYFEFVVAHHDGTNRFRVHLLSPVGLARYNDRGKVSVSNKENTIMIF